MFWFFFFQLHTEQDVIELKVRVLKQQYDKLVRETEVLNLKKQVLTLELKQMKEL